ncbi:hypothetical protein U0C82_10230 [Fulvimarina sp. 2208YS6-2-32]|uniref:HAD family hydrolase n=1 Tax=Fulvimarina uroteuthidis TaxID=3098149 RepID=A0ABU5I2C3_9HYPH|nr:hypothetical protein [Fulvimarina sp. 2208YS6-2-32]MDY8109516.1 hypothetical protein [Fulvimarina sp. 2208YS6-2-32]
MTARTRGVPVADIERRRDALLVLDIDEVVLQFIGPFQTLLRENGIELHFDSYKLTGNARSQATGAALASAELDGLMQRLYAEQASRQPPAEGVQAALSALDPDVDIVFLTAMDPDYHDERRATLDRAGLAYPMIATERSKGGVVAELARRWDGPIVFIDDLPPNLETVRRSVPHAHLVHLMAHHGFRPHLPALPKGAHAARDWTDAEQIVRAILADAPKRRDAAATTTGRPG